MPRRPIHHDPKRSRGVLMQVDPMSHVRLDVDLDITAIRETCVCCTRLPIQPRTVTPTENQIILARQIQYRPREARRVCLQLTPAEDLARRERILGRLGVGQDGRVEIGEIEEAVLVREFIAPGQVAGTPVREASGLVGGGEVEVRAGEEEGLVGGYLAVACQDDPVRQGWEGGGEGVGQG